MRTGLVCLSIVLALALWVWLTGPGTSLPLAIGGWIFAGAAGRAAFLLLRPRAGPPAVPPLAVPEPPPQPSTVIHPRPHPP